MNIQHDFTPNFLRLSPTKHRLTSAAGLGTLIEAFDQSPLKEPFSRCLADLEQFRKDPSLEEVMRGESAAPRTMGDFLRDFDLTHLANLNSFLNLQAKSYRIQLEKMLKKMFKPSLAPHLSIDSTAHVQHGKKMEGLAYNYNEQWCLDSQVIFDELGFCWDMELRAGNTKSGVGGPEQVRRAFASYKFKDEKYLSGDAAYCWQEMMTTCLGLGVGFTFTANQATTGWEDHISSIGEWAPWVYSKEEIRNALEHGYTLPEVELGRFYWQPSWNEVLRLPVVVKRTKVEQTTLMWGEWKYYGVVTNLPLIEWKLQEVIEHHNKRGNAENFIREEKYGYDLKHFPCLELKANHAYGLLAMVAHNILRWIAIHENPARPRFAKAIRHKFVYIPGKVVSHARQLVLRVSQAAFEEVNQLRMALQLKPYSAVINTG